LNVTSRLDIVPVTAHMGTAALLLGTLFLLFLAARAGTESATSHSAADIAVVTGSRAIATR
jgi:hypothetical protein